MPETDERPAAVPLSPVACRQCGARVLVRKSSWQQTTVQWDSAAMAACLERRAATPGTGPNGAVPPSCAGLRDSITRAALDGEIPVPESEGEQ